MEPGIKLTDLQLDLLCLLTRLQQLEEVRDTPLGELLLNRLITCDLPRMRKYLSPETIAWAEQVITGGESNAQGTCTER